MGLGFYLQFGFAQHALEAAFLVAISCGLIGPFVITRTMSFAVHGTSELAFTGAVAGLLVADNPLAGALVGALIVATLIGLLGQRPAERDSTIGVILAAGLGLGVFLLGYYHGYASEALNILFGNIFGISWVRSSSSASSPWWWPSSSPPSGGRCSSPPSTPTSPGPTACRRVSSASSFSSSSPSP